MSTPDHFPGITPFVLEAGARLGFDSPDLPPQVEADRHLRTLADLVGQACEGLAEDRAALFASAVDRIPVLLVRAEAAKLALAWGAEQIGESVSLPGVETETLKARVAELELENAELGASLASANTAHEDQVAALKARIEELEAAIDADPIGEDDTLTLGPPAEPAEEPLPTVADMDEPEPKAPKPAQSRKR